jgi:hypothetical protein
MQFIQVNSGHSTQVFTSYMIHVAFVIRLLDKIHGRIKLKYPITPNISH